MYVYIDMKSKHGSLPLLLQLTHPVYTRSQFHAAMFSGAADIPRPIYHCGGVFVRPWGTVQSPVVVCVDLIRRPDKAQRQTPLSPANADRDVSCIWQTAVLVHNLLGTQRHRPTCVVGQYGCMVSSRRGSQFYSCRCCR